MSQYPRLLTLRRRTGPGQEREDRKGANRLVHLTVQSVLHTDNYIIVRSIIGFTLAWIEWLDLDEVEL